MSLHQIETLYLFKPIYREVKDFCYITQRQYLAVRKSIHYLIASVSLDTASSENRDISIKIVFTGKNAGTVTNAGNEIKFSPMLARKTRHRIPETEEPM